MIYHGVYYNISLIMSLLRQQKNPKCLTLDMFLRHRILPDIAHTIHHIVFLTVIPIARCLSIPSSFSVNTICAKISCCTQSIPFMFSNHTCMPPPQSSTTITQICMLTVTRKLQVTSGIHSSEAMPAARAGSWQMPLWLFFFGIKIIACPHKQHPTTCPLLLQE
jgi:hypothetical protein